ncbi:DyP-type peroxidase [Fomitiporia mediterranea MF3/22]|uniref:DyP-type peroxidase n=1 Tax=Fomitiporia mediterranea (strain MF3/22) TaxID=694068 RepID=UPI000440910E|nr:DyP-type peroxidase [Fomitiporia mediterranea MF3/22]EJC98275.1 DyP-type peroxidase [Fomitiporia mediterranea MF3/22]
MTSTAWPTPQDLDDLQGDIVLGIPKFAEDFLFFNITNVANFKNDLKQIVPSITTTTQVQKMQQQIAQNKLAGIVDLVKISAINIAFTESGLKKLGVTDDLGDQSFNAGQIESAKDLGDGTTDSSGNFDPGWLDAFKNGVDGIFLFGGDSDVSILEGEAKVRLVFATSISEALTVPGRVRPDKEKGHEHFGFKDGISFPAIKGMVDPLPGQIEVSPGVIVCGTDGDTVSRPAWAKNGSFLVYRHLKQFVPEFNAFLKNNPIVDPRVASADQNELVGARMFGRWKSGAPIELAPFADDPTLAGDAQRNNNFDFSDSSTDQTICPFAAHIRKTNPRADLLKIPGGGGSPDFLLPRMINRQSIPFGPEVNPLLEAEKTVLDRGLAFVCYQSNITAGFEFVQKSWVNTESFPPQKPVQPGFDPIIGQKNGAEREMTGLNPNAQSQQTKLPFEFVQSKGGAYFFSPSISALTTKLSV